MIPMKSTPLSQLALISAGQGAPKDNEFSESGVPFVRAGSLEALLSGKSESELELVSPETAKLRKLKIYPKGTILFAKSGMSATKDRVYVLKNPAHVVSHLATLIPKDGANVDYLRLALKRFPPSSLIKDPAYPAIGLGEIENFEIPVPEEYNDQIRIAHLLGKVEVLIAQRKQHLQQLDDLLKSVFLEMFGGANKGVELTIGFAIKQGYILLHKDGNHGSNYPRKDEFGDFGVPFITAKSIDEFGHLMPSSIEHLNEEKAGKLTIGWIEGGDVLLAHNATVGRVGLYRGEFGRALIGTSLTAFRPNMDMLRPIYLHELLRSHFFQRQLFWGMGQATRNQVPITAQRELLIRVPEPSLQDRFAVIFERVEALKSCYQQSLADLESLYGALRQQAFKGELDLSRVALPTAPFEGESPVAVVVPTPATTLAIHLPETDLLLPAIEDRKQLKPLLRFWLEAYRSQLGSTAFSTERFIAVAQTRIAELHSDNGFELGSDAYEYIKAWVFESLAAGTLIQAFDDAGNRIELKAAVAQDPA
jgi:type I restriction enzyme S subunit